jgi:DNA-binding NtrC family response regulator
MLMHDLSEAPCPNECARLFASVQNVRSVRPLSPREDLPFLRNHLLVVRIDDKFDWQAARTLKEKRGKLPMLGVYCSRAGLPPLGLWPVLTYFDDVLFCPFTQDEILRRIRRVMDRWESRRRSSPSGISNKSIPSSPEIIGRSGSIEQIRRKGLFLANIDAPLVILGEPGTGKELFARFVHNRGPRRQKPFVAIDCGALHEPLFEGEHFDEIDEPLTDAASEEKGVLEAAEGGTLFLDNIDALTPEGQVQLLRVLQQWEYPFRASQTKRTDVRIIAATHADLLGAVKEKRFRDDLYYRVNVLWVSLPPLRERLEDLPLLAAFFLKRNVNRYCRRDVHLTESALQKLLAYHWPGNVRELESVIRQSLMMTDATEIDADDIEHPGLCGIAGTPAENLPSAESEDAPSV